MGEKPGEPESFEVRIPSQEGVGRFSRPKNELDKKRAAENRGDKTKEELARAAKALKREEEAAEANAREREAAKKELEQKMFDRDMKLRGKGPKEEMKEAA